MNKISDEQIMEHLNKQYDRLIDTYGSNRILGVFVYGKANYGFAEKLEDVEAMACYLPTFEELCGARPKTFALQTDKIKIKITDLRLVLGLARQQVGTVIETVFTDYYVINPEYQKIFTDYIYVNREVMFHCNKAARVSQSVEAAFRYIDDYKTTKDRNSLFNACRHRIATRLYLNGTSIENCINLKKDYHITYLWGILDGSIEPDLQEIEDDLLEMKKTSEKFVVNKADENLITEGVIELIRASLNPPVSAEDFVSTLTDNEKEAFKVIQRNLPDGEGNISISKLLLETPVSRPVFKNTLQKMKDNNVAQVDNQGVKGMYVKFLKGDI